jgi:hypothetical protein
MTLFVVDIEADGPYPVDYSMVSFGIVKVQTDLKNTPTFYGKVAPVSELWIPAALAVSGHTREEHLKFDDPVIVMKSAKQFVESNNDGRSILVSDNNGFDAAWINAYMHKFAGGNPFGHSSRRIGDLYAGLRKNFRDQNGWKKHKTTKHTHNPVDDAMGNAEALLFICQKYGISI